MKTYVTINNEEKRYDTIDEAVNSIGEEIDEVEINVWNEDGEKVDSQISARSQYSNDFVYYAWGVIGYKFEDAEYIYGKDIEDTDVLGEGYNTREEAIEAARKFSDSSKYDVICAESWDQTVSENIGDRYEGTIVINNLDFDVHRCKIINQFDMID